MAHRSIKGESTSLGVLSTRQRVLLQRLEAICERVATKVLPVHVVEIWGFGSFFRAKERPGDLDLIVKFSQHEMNDTIYDLFNKLMDEAIKVHKDFSAPKGALLHIVRSKLGEEMAGRLVPIFSEWLEGYTWDMIFSESLPGLSYSWETVTKRVLTRNIAGISIPRMVKVDDTVNLKAEALFLVWSITKPDVYDNIKQFLAPSRVHETVLTELENFDRQIANNRFEINIVQRLFHELLHTELNIRDYKEFEVWVEGKAQACFPDLPKDSVSKAVRNIDGGFWRQDPEIPFTFEEAYYKNMRDTEIKETVEKRREELKETTMGLEVSRVVLRELRAWKRETLDERSWAGMWSAEEYVALMTLRDIPKKLVKEQKIREYLRKLGLPENKVLADRLFGSKAQYVIPEGPEEERKIINRNKLVETKRNYISKLQPEVKRVRRELSLEIEFDEKLKPILAEVWYHHSDWSDKPVSDSSVQSLLSWCKEHGFTVEKQKYGTYAQLKIPIEDCSDIKQIKRRISDALL